MGLATSVPLNTTLADLDESLRALLRRELGRHGFDGVAVAFDAPSRDWAAALSGPTVNMFMYEVQEAAELRDREWQEHRGGNGNARISRPPLRIDCAFAVTAWARAVEDEHRLLSQVLAILYAYEHLPPPDLAGSLGDPAVQRFPLQTRTARARSDGRADFWNAVGGQYKASLDYVVTLACEAGVTVTRGPGVRTQTLRMRNRNGRDGSVEEFHRAGGRVTDAAGQPAGNAWVALVETGTWTTTDADGRFVFNRVAPGRHRCTARATDGSEATGELAVPGPAADLRLTAGS
jgi:Pvc16 N-terminal domain/Carboxypeptidase regulatory-like domain